MNGGSGRKPVMWRWRDNPLRRHDDVVEAWIVLVMWVLVAVGGTLAGLFTARAADDAFARQREERYAVRAELLADAPDLGARADGASTRVVAKIRWTTHEGVTRTDTALVDSGGKAGSRVQVWLDEAGRLSTEPPSATEAAVEAAVLGLAAASATSGLVVGAGSLLRWRLDRRRIDAWGREWELIGPRWDHKTS
ncbi:MULTISPECIES: Rv1733c family protein [unclassified Streptomyces]|uniref:Rv1733c family protein n=1 Tax=unclassified Streptomyces TaxID=2593676 RepID=UPI003D761668